MRAGGVGGGARHAQALGGEVRVSRQGRGQVDGAHEGERGSRDFTHWASSPLIFLDGRANSISVRLFLGESNM